MTCKCFVWYIKCIPIGIRTWKWKEVRRVTNKGGKGQDARTENMCLNTENLTPNIKP